MFSFELGRIDVQLLRAQLRVVTCETFVTINYAPFLLDQLRILWRRNLNVDR